MTAPDTTPTPFRASLPVTFTSFINRCGMIGLSLLPMLLVDRLLPAAQSATVMGAVKVCALLGTIVGGVISDRFGLKAALLVSFALNGLGLAAVPFVDDVVVLTACSGVAQLGSAMFPGAARLLIAELVLPGQQQEAIGWQRTAANFGQIISYSIGTLASSWGLSPLFLFDAVTSVAAVVVGMVLVPDRAAARKDDAPAPASGKDHGWGPFLVVTFITCVFLVLYEGFSVSAAARAKILFGDDGLSVFSRVMVINTLFCAVFAVVAARRLTRPDVVFPAGLVLLAAGLSVMFVGELGRWGFFLGALVISVGEIVFMALSAYVLMRVTPSGRRRGTIYSTTLLMQFGARIVGGAGAFPLLVEGTHPVLFVWAVTVAGLVLCVAGRHQLVRRDA